MTTLDHARRLRLERDDGPWYVIDGTGLERVADTGTSSLPHAKLILAALQTGEMPNDWRYAPPTPGPGRRWARLHSRPRGGIFHLVSDVWLPQLTAFGKAAA